MASIYYGTEAGLTGQDDPDDRRPYPWDAVDTELRDWYATLGTLRRDHASLRTGGLEFLLADDTAGTLAYLRRGDDEASVVVLNLSDAEQRVTLDVAGRLPTGAVLADAISGTSVTIGDGPLVVSLAPRGTAILVTADGTDLRAPDAPAGLAATPAPGRVDLAWRPVSGAAGYDVWRSIVPGGGYERVGTTAEASFADATVRNGTRAYYVVTAVDASGNASDRSPEADALPAAGHRRCPPRGPGRGQPAPLGGRRRNPDQRPRPGRRRHARRPARRSASGPSSARGRPAARSRPTTTPGRR